jgi:hypothetical protein
MSVATSADAPGVITQFGPDAPITSLPSDFQACLSGTAPPSVSCDALVGSMQSGQGYCAAPPYRTMTYCACVNNAIPCPMIAASACANSALAYAPTSMLPPSAVNPGGGREYQACKGQAICVNLVEVGGNQNVVSGITQQCGVFQNIQNVLKLSPQLAGMIIVLFIILVIVASIRTEPDGGAAGARPAERTSRRLPPLPRPVF